MYACTHTHTHTHSLSLSEKPNSQDVHMTPLCQQLPAIEKKVTDAKHKVLTPLISLDTPGKATVQVVILADPVRSLCVRVRVRGVCVCACVCACLCCLCHTITKVVVFVTACSL